MGVDRWDRQRQKVRQHERQTHGDGDINREEDRHRNESVFPAPPNLPALLSAVLHSCPVLLFLILSTCVAGWLLCPLLLLPYVDHSAAAPDAPLSKHCLTTSIQTSSGPP